MINVKNVSVKFSNEAILKNINLNINKGEFILISGKSGSGKSTLGSVINGLIPHYHKAELFGDIFVKESNTKDMQLFEIGRIIGTVFQDPRSQFFTTNTDDEIAFGLQTILSTKEDIFKRVDEVYKELDICELKDKSVFELSSGEKQKIAVASSYAMNPEVIILDEPSANLDMRGNYSLYKMLKKLKELGTTIILIEHRLYYVKSLFDRFILMKDGEIVDDFTRDEILLKDKMYFKENALRYFDLKNCDIKKKDKTDFQNILVGENIAFSYKVPHTRNNRHRKEIEVIKNLDFKIKSRKSIGIIGLNGSGKTTLARIICGLNKISGGEIKNISNQIVNANQLLKESYFVFQDSDYQLFSESVLDEMLIGISDETEIEKSKAKSLLEELGIYKYKDKHPFSLSRGEKQRLTIACGMMKDAKYFIYDEPTSGCDRNSMISVSKLINKQSENVSTLIISHDYEFLLMTVDELWLINNGKIEKMLSVTEENKDEILSIMGGSKLE